MKNGMKEKREEHVKNVKRFAGEAEKSYLCHRRQAMTEIYTLTCWMNQ